MVGSFEQLVLLAVVRLSDAAYGMAIRDEIVECSGRRVSLGAVYATLDRLCTKGYLSVTSGAGTAKRCGRPRKFFRLEPPGRLALERSLETLRQMLEGVPKHELQQGLG